MRFKSTRALLVFVAMFVLSAVAASSAWASGRPLMETKPATGIKTSEAELFAVVNPNNAETKYHFEYGTTESYGKNTTEVTMAAGISNVEPLQKVTGLLALTKYDFRIVATNSHGTTYGANEAFTTAGAEKPFVETGSATARTETSATLNGVVNPNDAETKYYFEYGTTESYGTKTAETSAGSGTVNLNESTTITGLKAKTTYYFRIVATNTKGTTDGKDKTFYSEVGPEFNPGRAGETFTGTAGDSRWEYGGAQLTCTASTVMGELTSAQAVGNLVVKFTGCKSIKGAEECTVKSTNTTTEGEIVPKTLTAELGSVAKSEAETGVGLRLKPESTKAWFTLEGSKCAVEETFDGDLAAEVVGLSLSTKHELILERGTSGMKIKEITLDSGIAEKPEFEAFVYLVSIETDYHLTFSAAVEIT
jgi:hypothetical protein